MEGSNTSLIYFAITIIAGVMGWLVNSRERDRERLAKLETQAAVLSEILEKVEKLLEKSDAHREKLAAEIAGVRSTMKDMQHDIKTAHDSNS